MLLQRVKLVDNDTSIYLKHVCETLDGFISTCKPGQERYLESVYIDCRGPE